MNPKDQELMERYIYQVVRRLPKAQRNEVGLELQELICDMQEEGASMEAVLTKLGDPAEFAKKYQDGSHHLIGPQYYDTYLRLLKIVMLCALIPLFVISVVEGVLKGIPAENAWWVNSIAAGIAGGLGNGIANCVVSFFSIFGAVTLIFAILERRQVKVERRQKEDWSVRDLGDNFSAPNGHWTPKALAPIPHKKAVISRGDSIANIVFTVIFCVLLVFAPKFFSAVFKTGEELTVIPFFNQDAWNVILPVLICSLLIGLADEIFRLVTGCFCKAVMVSSIVSGALQIVLSIVVLKILPFMNPHFLAEIQARTGKASSFFAKWNGERISSFLLGFIVLITLLEMGTTVYRTLRYGAEKEKI